ncbi:hypothetical protein, partial [Mycobacterium tuberculosis]|uniref:hypothetical protein n=1 Tax=Mycobacterium tuberculosis TaxID=1773 RepID=UPI001F46D2CD
IRPHHVDISRLLQRFTHTSSLVLTLRHTPGYSVFFFNDPATTEVFTPSLHEALPIYVPHRRQRAAGCTPR